MQGWITLLLVFVRLAAVTTTMPVIGSTQGVPKHVAILLAMALTIVVGPSLPVAPLPDTVGALVLAVAGELASGLVVGLGVTAVFASLTVAAEVMDQQMGFGSLTSLDPVGGASEGSIGALGSLLAAAVFIGTNLHLTLLVCVADSLVAVPPGTAGLPLDAAAGLSVLVGESLSLGVQLAGPVLVFLLLVQVFVAILTRMAPRMNVFFSVGMSISNVAGLVVLLLALAWILPVHHEAAAAAVKSAAGWIR